MVMVYYDSVFYGMAWYGLFVLPISSLGFDLSLSLDLNLGLRGQYYIFQARRPKFCKVVDIDSTNRLYIPCHTIPYLS